MDKQAYLEDIYKAAFQDELDNMEKAASQLPKPSTVARAKAGVVRPSATKKRFPSVSSIPVKS